MVASLTIAPVPAAHALVEDNLDAYAQAWISEVTDDHNDAATKYAELLTLDPGNASISQNLWNSAIQADDYKKALRAARLLELQETTPETALMLFADALTRRSWKDARSVIASMQNNNYNFLIPLFESWLRVAKGQAHNFPERPTNQLLLFYSGDQYALLHAAAGDWSAAQAEISRYRRDDSAHMRDLRLRLAPAFAARGEGQFARNLVDDLVPGDIANMLSSSRQKSTIRTITPRDGLSMLYTRLANALVEQNVPTKGLALARMATWMSPGNDAGRMALANAFQNLEQASQQRMVLASLGAKSPYWAQATNLHIRSLLSSNNPQGALNVARKALKTRNSAEIALLLGEAQQAAGLLDDAVDTFSGVIAGAEKARVSPQRRSIYQLYLATVLHEQGKWQIARQALEEGIALNPQNPYLINYLGYSLLERGEELKPALEMLQKAHRLAPQSMAITDSLGWGYFLTGDYSNAVYYLEKAAKGSGNDLTINEHLGDAYWLSGRFVDARYAWRIAVQTAEGEDKKRLDRKIDLGLINKAVAAN